jgi:hypothetical protein
MAKERNQNVTVDDEVILRLVTYNSNSYKDAASVDKVEIYRLDPTLCSEMNPDGRYLVDTITDITSTDTGQYSITLPTTSPAYTIGKYIDIWYVVFEDEEQQSQVINKFEIYPDLWYTSTMPAVYGFSFQFQPNRIRKGSKKWLQIKINPEVPRATDIERYYTNIAISSNLSVSIEQNCGQCVPPEETELIVEDDLVYIRDRIFGFYQLDTTENGLDLDCGIYNIWFTLNYADSIEVSPKMQFQIY